MLPQITNAGLCSARPAQSSKQQLLRLQRRVKRVVHGVPVQNVTIFQSGKDVTYVQAWANVFSNMLLEVKSDSATLARAA